MFENTKEEKNMRDLEEWTTVKRNLDEYHIRGCGLCSSESEQDAVADVRPSQSRIPGQTHTTYGENVLGKLCAEIHRCITDLFSIYTITNICTYTSMQITYYYPSGTCFGHRNDRNMLLKNNNMWLCICWLSYTSFNARICSAKRN